MTDLRLYLETYHHYVYLDVLVVRDETAYLADDIVNERRDHL